MIPASVKALKKIIIWLVGIVLTAIAFIAVWFLSILGIAAAMSNIMNPTTMIGFAMLFAMFAASYMSVRGGLTLTNRISKMIK